MKEVLMQTLDITEQQAEIYLALLELGPTSVGKLINKIIIDRSSCYDCLKRLIKRGLVTYIIKDKKRYFEAVNPERLLQILNEQESTLERKKEELTKMMPALMEKSKSKTRLEEATVYKTKQGMRSFFDLTLKDTKKILVISGTGKALKNMPYYFIKWHKIRQEKNIAFKIVFNNELKGDTVTNMPFCAIKFMPKEYSAPSTTLIFGGKVGILLWSDTPTAFVIDSKEIAKTYKKYFELIWSISKK